MSLYLQNNRLKDLLALFPEFKFLATLNVSNNQLKVIPVVASKITIFKDLDMSFNAVEALLLNIRDLYVLGRFSFLGNMISRVPDAFCRLERLEYMGCRRN
ncbi:hypothetical protein P691DRAFT_769469 [Macrolepiota fuliginosa MF-IS2]|uniref:Uncharacterized protein n=1 Tax=Macrolepiota fuliginosa MF-IS2 TaxID=1400762 RepID=A0A9P5WYA8_9AGAR|nr:hypothetical protein P691DRAFT_769469 [Macrolepiota fuliginosa MF-IS2]